MKILSILAGGRIGIKDSDPIIGEFDAGWISVPELLHIMYGPRLWKHPKKDETESYINMRLEALVESGDVEEDNGSRSRYRAKGRALETLSKYEEDNRRHRESVLRSWASLALTAVIAVATVAQVMLQTDFSKLFGP